jgi:hypothetical protein
MFWGEVDDRCGCFQKNVVPSTLEIHPDRVSVKIHEPLLQVMSPSFK